MTAAPSAEGAPIPQRLWTVPPQVPFLDALVTFLFERYGRDPLALAGTTVLLPTRRAARSLRDAFLRASGGTPMLLPRMAAPGDIDADEIELAMAEPGDGFDLPPALPLLRRQLLLAQLVRRWSGGEGTAMLPGQAVALAGDLARLIDQAHTEGVSFDRLEALVPAELAQHWALTVRFLAILRDHWPVLLAAEGAVDPAERRNLLIAAQVAQWQASPPTGPVIAAGFSAAVPSVASLVAAVLALPDGWVILPGLDTGADTALWQAVREDPTHPQHGMARLLDRLGNAAPDRSEIPTWPLGDTDSTRALLGREAMRPAADSHRWRSLGPLPAGALDGLSRLDLGTPHEEAGAVALMLRQQLERPGATAMLVTPDRGLARRVAAELGRWKIDIDDSAGLPLGQTPPGIFLRLLGEAALEALAPVPLLALLKHPLAAAGLSTVALREQVRRLELRVLRGPRPAPGFAGLRAAAAAADPASLALIDRLETAIGEFLALAVEPEVRLDQAIAAHLRAAEALAATETETGAARLWALEAGEALAGFAAEFIEAAAGFEPIAGADYPVLFEATLGGRVVRPRWGKHPRLQILGTLEARLQSADLVILGGLNEGVWPGQAAPDPFLSRPMRLEFGLEAPEAQTGLAAHDFLTGFAAPEVVLTRARKAEGAPTVPSRWLLRLDTVLRASGLQSLPRGPRDVAALAGWQAALDRPNRFIRIEPPAPRPPFAARPRKLPVTEIETWMRDPYAIYARHILRLRALEPLDADPGVAERGVFIHQALDQFIRDHAARAGALPPDALMLLEAAGREAFGDALARPAVWAFWWPRFRRIARWFVETEAARRPDIARSLTERTGEMEILGGAEPFRLTAKADRIDLLRQGGLALIDYKTGTLPSKQEIELGFSPQLPLEAAMAASGAFAEVAAAPVAELGFWRLSGGEPAGEMVLINDPEAAAEAAHGGLERLIAAFDDPRTPYRARPLPAWAPRYSDYAHLARIAEWGAGDLG